MIFYLVAVLNCVDHGTAVPGYHQGCEQRLSTEYNSVPYPTLEECHKAMDMVQKGYPPKAGHHNLVYCTGTEAKP